MRAGCGSKGSAQARAGIESKATQISTKGSHAACVGIRGVPVVEAVMACALADQALLHRAQCGE